MREDRDPPRSRGVTYATNHCFSRGCSTVWSRAGNTVIVVEHEMRVVADSDWVIDIGPGAGEEGGQIVAQGTPREVAQAPRSRTAPYLARLREPR